MRWLQAGTDSLHVDNYVFEVLSPGNRAGELVRKLGFYERYGVEECYIYDPDNGELLGWRRHQGKWQEIPNLIGWISPRLGVRFEQVGLDLELYAPSGEKFATYLELVQQREQARHDVEQARLDAEQARQRAERLEAQLAALGVTPDR